MKRLIGPREKEFLAEAARDFPPDGAGYLEDPIAQTIRREKRLLDALEEALEGWDYAAQYKDEFLRKKHGDNEDIARLRVLLKEEDI